MKNCSKQGLLLCILFASAGLIFSHVPLAQAGERQLQAVNDTFIKNNAPSQNFGNYPSGAPYYRLEVFQFGAAESHTLLKFDLSTIPEDSEITAATLYLHTASHPTRATNLELFHTSNDNWNEDTATWNNFYAPEQETTLLSRLDELSPTASQYYAWNLNIAEWNYGMDVKDKTLSFILKFGLPPNPLGREADFHSSEGTNWGDPSPLLDIQFTHAPEPLSTLLFLSGAPLMGFSLWTRKKRLSS